VLGVHAGDAERKALVREATALSGLEGLGIPAVIAFGALADGRRYLVRELVEGRSLEELFEASVLSDAPSDPRAWIEPLADAAEQLSALHRAGLLHGDIKPANVIAGTLVDLGLATPLREGGARARGLTPRYAAPELLAGAPLTVRAEVFALGATLGEGLARRGSDLDDATRLALVKVAMRAQEEDPKRRYPSASELASALREAAGIARAVGRRTVAWPVLGHDAPSEALLAAVRELAPGGLVRLAAAPGAGASTLLRRLAWTLGLEGETVVLSPARDRAVHLALELAPVPGARPPIVLLDDADDVDATARAQIEAARAGGARIVLASTTTDDRWTPSVTITIPPLADDAVREIVHRTMPSFPEHLVPRLASKTAGLPGRLRAAIDAIGDRAVVTEADVDRAIAGADTQLDGDPLVRAEHALDAGRLHEAAAALEQASPGAAASVAAAVARARLAMARGDAAAANEALANVTPTNASERRLVAATRARALFRSGKYEPATTEATAVLGVDDRLTADALTVLGLARALVGDDAAARKHFEDAIALARTIDDARALGVALGSAAIAHQRAGRIEEAHRAYQDALVAAERANDASTVAATRLNLAALARASGDLATALGHLEAVVDLASRAGGLLAIQQARLNLVNLDLYVGRLARARENLHALERDEDLGPAARAQLEGCRAELAARTGDVPEATARYRACSAAWEAQGRPLDAAEAALESIVVRARSGGALGELKTELEAQAHAAANREGGFGEHAALAALARGLVALRAQDERTAQSAFDEAVRKAKDGEQHERSVWALEARARFHAQVGNRELSRRDFAAALALLEETAGRLPRDLREVFWDDPRRRELRVRASETETSKSVHELSRSLPRPAEDKLARVLEITREIATEHDLGRLLAKVTDHAIALLGGERGFLLLVTPDGELSTQAARDRKGDDPHATFSRSVAERVLDSGEPVVATQAREDARLASAVSVHQLMIQSIACVPVRGAPPLGRAIGALYVETRLRPGARFEQELPTLLAFADQAAIAIENARLLGENQRRQDELEKKSAELEAAQARLRELLGRKSELLAATRRDLHRVRAELRSHFGYAGLVGNSTAMRKLYALIDRVKDTDVPVLVVGESGTGKEVVARAVHDAGPRAKHPFLGVNCGAIPENLLESELFGHVRGAFTGADRERRGLFREAEGGTILLDEIGEMPLKMQAGLLRVLQERTVRPVGGAKEEPVSARVIAATNRELEAMVGDGTFREDLFYRLHVVELRVPPLRERSEDIALLIDHFLSIFANRYRRERKSVERDALRRLAAYDWPGNVRQLEHVLLNAWLMSEGKELALDDFTLPEPTRPTPGSSHKSRPRATPATTAEHRDSERERILRALTATNWNRVKAAQLVGMPRRTFYRRLKEFGIL
jgi:transcriptional regulator with GAF, ATPase, and Fis domain